MFVAKRLQMREGAGALEPAPAIDGDALVTRGGTKHHVDTIVLCTGFQQQRFLFPLEIAGRSGQLLRELWDDDDARAYLGITTPGFPNLFFLYGPNTNPPGGSWVTIAEAQTRYIVDLVAAMVQRDLSAVECKPDVFEEYNRDLDANNDRMVYAMEGVSSYYRNSRGRVVTNSPWTVPDYWNRTSHVDLDDYHVTPDSSVGAAGRTTEGE